MIAEAKPGSAISIPPGENRGGAVAPDVATSEKNGLVSFLSNEQLDEQARMDEAMAARENSPVLSNIAAHMNNLWGRAEDAKRNTEQELLMSLRQRKGEYEAEQLAAIREQGGSEVFMRLTATKCVAAEAWIEDVISNGQDRPFALESTPIPELPETLEQAIKEQVMEAIKFHQNHGSGTPLTPEIVHQYAAGIRESVVKRLDSQAVNAAKKMEKQIQDQFLENSFYEKLLEGISDVVTFKTGWMKGPVIEYETKLQWVVDPRSGRIVPKEFRVPVPKWHIPSPFDIYPSPNCSKIGHGYMWEVHNMLSSEIEEWKGMPGFNDANIDKALNMFADKGHREWRSIDYQREALLHRENSFYQRNKDIAVKEYTGTISGNLLKEFGVSGEFKPFQQYPVKLWMIGNEVIFCRLNSIPLGLWDYSAASYEKIPGSIWGVSVPEKMADIQSIINATTRSLVNNLSIASGPQAWIDDINRLAEGEDVEAMFPWKLWQFNNDAATNKPPMGFFQPNDNSHNLMRVFETYHKLADEHTGIPAYQQGNDKATSGAGRTASGLSMLMNASARGVRKIISNIDIGFVAPGVYRQFLHEMLYNNDESIKGDITVKPKGAVAMIVKEQMALRRQEFLNITNNPTDLLIMGPERRANVLRESAKSLDMDPGDVVPSAEELPEELQARQQQNAEQEEPQRQGE